MGQEGQQLTTAPPPGLGNPILSVLGNRKASNTDFSQVVCANPKTSSLWVGLETHLEGAQPCARVLQAPPCILPQAPPLQLGL